MNDNSNIEIRILTSRTAYRSFDVQDEPLVAEAIRTRVLPVAEAAYWRVDVKVKRKPDQTPKYLIAYPLLTYALSA